MRYIYALLILLWVVTVQAAPDERGALGFYLGVGGGLGLGQASDDEGEDAGSFTGMGGHLRFGEEVLPSFTLGLDLISLGGTGNNDRYEGGLGGFLLQAGWRPFSWAEALLLIGGLGVGGSSLEPKGDEGYEGVGGGALYQLGLNYEFRLKGGANEGGFTLAPSLYALFSPADSNPVGMNALSLGLDLLWYAGR